ncbi:chemotaxis protein CheD [Clostridium formicaceticum]|uniref:Probable chemoreceptor glutamine deamidase CheD n=1 Tax=Clostridium formicaceticum TaxID=1497 RepID=A0AAC9RKS8_9CLOT|nr:chemotaxis protein CheD [Clostridium formicaceticum]AOY77294.1 chemotaxis protein CheD [Clostridium formicaceticum]ARE87836.1 Chemoreceptor glutamine deamidase CheD [Clostridium formicaceticum]
MQKTIKVGMADLKITKFPEVLTTLGLGSCVGIALYDLKVQIIGLAHIMLPNSNQIKNNNNKAKFADTAINILLEEMIKAGGNKSRTVAKIAGGAQMFSFGGNSDVMKIGYRNVVATKEVLQDLKIPLLAEDTGGNHGRTIEVYGDTGKLLVKTIGHGVKEI